MSNLDSKDTPMNRPIEDTTAGGDGRGETSVGQEPCGDLGKGRKRSAASEDEAEQASALKEKRDSVAKPKSIGESESKTQSTDPDADKKDGDSAHTKPAKTTTLSVKRGK